jgi:tetratricopeptide (TPR) repeat protein
MSNMQKRVSTAYQLSLAMTLALGLGMMANPTWAVSPQSYQYYVQAQQAERRGNLEGAERALRQAIAMDPQDYLNYVKLASLLNQQGKPNEAVSYYQQALNINPQDMMILYSLGSVYEQLGQYAKAEEAYALSLQNNPRYQFALLNLARTQIQQKKYQPAIENYQQFLSKYPEHYEARRHLAKLYLVTGQETESIKQYDFLKKHYPGQFGEHLDLARAFNGANAPEMALEELKVAYAKEGSKSDIDEEMGRAHAALGQMDLAIHNYQKAYALNPRKEELLLKMAELYRVQKKTAPAISQYQAYLKLHPNDQNVRQLLVNTYFDAHQYAPALDELSNLLQTTADPQGRYNIQKDMAYATQMLGDLPKAISLYELLINEPQAEKDLQFKSNLAIAYHKSGSYEKAIPLYKQIYYAEPKLQETYQINRNSIGNDLAGALTTLGDAAYKAGDFNVALSAYADATLYAGKENHWPYLGLGNTYYALQMPDKAYDAYGTVLERDPNNVTAKLYRAKLAMASAKTGTPTPQNAQDPNTTNIATLEALAKDNPGNLEVLVTLADAYAEQGNANGAISIYEKALAVEPNNVDLLLAIGTQWQQLGNFEQAKNTYLKALAINNKLPMVHYNLGIVYNELGQLDQSAAAYKQAMSLDPAYTDSKYGLAITLEKQQKYQDALETYQSYITDPQAKYVKEASDRIELLKQALNPAAVQPARKESAVPANTGGTKTNGTVKPSGSAGVKQAPSRIEPTTPTPKTNKPI